MRTKVHFRRLEAFLRIVLLSGVALVGACRSSSPVAAPEATSITYPGLEWLTTADPIRDCTAAWERGDHRFIGVYDFTPHTPGVPKNATEIVKANGVRYLEGTSDALKSAEHGRAVTKATEYARRYNTALLEKLQNAK